MVVKTLYKYQREGGGVTVSPIKPDCEYSEKYRLIADEGKLLVKDGHEPTPCIDTDDVDGWYEIEAESEKVEG